MKLNIIGNGFDLYHGLPSSYLYFAKYLIKSEDEFYEAFCQMYGINYMKMIGPPIAHKYTLTAEDMFWSSFEAKLADISDDFVLNHIPDDLGLENPDPVEVEINDDIISEDIKKHFENWIEKTLNIKENYEIIKNIYLESKYKLDLDKKDFFLQFNYTQTIEKVYDIDDKNILYIHGKCGEKLIVGHGDDKKIRHIENDIEELEKDYMFDQSQNNRIAENYCILRYLQKTRKDTESCRDDAKWFYENRVKNNVEKICVYGLSLGDVDLPYLEDVRKIYPNAIWNFYSFSDADKIKAKFIATNNLMLDPQEFEIKKFDNPLSIGICKVLFEMYNLKQKQKIKSSFA